VFNRDKKLSVSLCVAFSVAPSLEILTGVLTAAVTRSSVFNFKWAYRNKPKQGIYNNGFAVVALVSTKFSLTDYRVTIISSEIENESCLKFRLCG
jgi:hypothetical protein